MKHYSLSVDKKDLEIVLTKWGELSEDSLQIVDNIFNEHFIDNGSMDNIMKEVYSKKNFENNIHDHILKYIRRFSLFKGSFIKRDCPNLIGTVMPLSRFKNFITSNYDSMIDTDFTFDKFMTQLLTRTLRGTHKEISIKDLDRAVWFTWNETDCFLDPFTFMKTNLSEEARLALGLGYDFYKRTELIAFIFKPKIMQNLYRPTFCDSDLSPYFRPTEKDFDLYGKTFVLNDGKFMVSDKTEHSLDVEYMPEAIDVSSNFKLNDLWDVRIYETI